MLNKYIVDCETINELGDIGCIVGRIKSVNKVILNLISMGLDDDLALSDIVVLHLLLEKEIYCIDEKINNIHLKFGI